ncbi:MAG: serine/threonine-protein kinase [Polyangiaceae bacterium]
MGRPLFLRSDPQDLVLELPGGRTVRPLDSLGRGSEATVYRARLDDGAGLVRTVALKLFDALPTETGDATLKVLQDAFRASAGVRHPNVVGTYEFGVTDAGQPFVVEECVEGLSLAELVNAHGAVSRRLPTDIALFLGVEIAEALSASPDAADAPGRHWLVHGGLGARQVLVSRHGEVKVSDFGLARARSLESGIRDLRSVAEKLVPMAPEVANGGTADARSDVFSLGILLWELVVGPRFSPDMRDHERMVASREGAIHESAFAPVLDPELRELFRVALAAEPRMRLPHASYFGRSLRTIALRMGVGDSRVFLRSLVDSLRLRSMENDVTRAERGGSSRPPRKGARSRGRRG